MMFEDDKAGNGEVTEYFRAVIAGKKIEIECKYRDVFNACRDYLKGFDVPDFVIGVTAEEIEYERMASRKCDEADGGEIHDYSDAALETMAVCRRLSDALLDEGFLLFHGAAIAAEGKCYLFLAKSGTGKTTHIRKWLKLYPDTYVVNGDKPLIDANNLMVYGTPWCGKEKMSTDTAVTLGGIIWLERGEENEIESISFSQMFPQLIKQCHIPQRPGANVKVIQMMDKLKSVPCYKLRCNMDDEAGEISYGALVLK